MRVSNVDYVEMSTSRVRSRYIIGLESKLVTIHLGVDNDQLGVCHVINKHINSLISDGTFKRGSKCQFVNIPDELYPICITVEIDNELKLISLLDNTSGNTNRDLCHYFTNYTESII